MLKIYLKHFSLTFVISFLIIMAMSFFIAANGTYARKFSVILLTCLIIAVGGGEYGVMDIDILYLCLAFLCYYLFHFQSFFMTQIYTTT